MSAPLLAVLGAVALVLLIACANVMNLLLARGVQRQGEFAIRAALGAGVPARRPTTADRKRLPAGAAGRRAWSGRRGCRCARARVAQPRGSAAPECDSRRLACVAIRVRVTSVAGILFGRVLPCAASGRAATCTTASRWRRGGPPEAAALRARRSWLVKVPLALDAAGLIGGLLIRSMQRVFASGPGSRRRTSSRLQIQTSGTRFVDDSAVWRFYGQVVQAVRTLPGVQTAGVTTQLPLSGDFDKQGVHIESHPRANPEEDPSVFRYGVSPGYLETMGIALRRGRLLGREDGAGRPPVIVVSESFARRTWLGEEPIGQRVRFREGSNAPWYTVVGVVADVKQTSLSATADRRVLCAGRSSGDRANNAMTLVVKTSGDPIAFTSALRQAVWSVDKDQPIVRVATMDELLTVSEAQRRFALILFECFAGIAALLAAAGIYGVLSGSVAERIREIGVRSALGASRTDILTMIVRQGLGMTGIGVAIGVAGAVLSRRVLAGLLFGVSGVDAMTYGSVTLLLCGIALVACAVPAWRAARVDPAVTLRAE